MNVNKISLLIVGLFLAFGISANDGFRNDLNLVMGLKYGKDTVKRNDFSFLPMLSYRFYFNAEIEEIHPKVIYDEDDDYGMGSKITGKSYLIQKRAYFLDLLLGLKFSDKNTYEKFLVEERKFLDFYVGAGYFMHLRNRIYITFYGGGNFYKESNTRGFNEEYASEDLDMKYESDEYSFTDYGLYAGFETVFFTAMKEIKNTFTISFAFTYNYKFKLNENYLIASFNLGYKF